ncbi:uncharacterized protein [Agelaius tricolor]|uniref:uncharacterized protein isoform X2 n=1 Tax=Agelaius tricolor TaxID=9191 RepID=UPI0039F218DC
MKMALAPILSGSRAKLTESYPIPLLFHLVPSHRHRLLPPTVPPIRTLRSRDCFESHWFSGVSDPVPEEDEPLPLSRSLPQLLESLQPRAGSGPARPSAKEFHDCALPRSRSKKYAQLSPYSHLLYCCWHSVLKRMRKVSSGWTCLARRGVKSCVHVGQLIPTPWKDLCKIS